MFCNIFPRSLFICKYKAVQSVCGRLWFSSSQVHLLRQHGVLLATLKQLRKQQALKNEKYDGYATQILEHLKVPYLQSAIPENPPDIVWQHTVADPKYIYKEVQRISNDHLVDILLLETISDVGTIGQVISVAHDKAHLLLLPKLGVYASRENLEKYSDLQKGSVQGMASSMFVSKTVQFAGGLLAPIELSMTNPWELQPWHVRAALRKVGLILRSQDVMQLPPRPISGPNMAMQNKQFYVTVTINDRETVNVRCFIHHVTKDFDKKLPATSVASPTAPPVALFPEDQEYLTALFNQRPPTKPYTEPQLTPEMVRQGITSTGGDKLGYLRDLFR